MFEGTIASISDRLTNMWMMNIESIEHINAEIQKLDLVDKNKIDNNHHRINDIEENKIKELEDKINGIEEKIKESIAGQQTPGSASYGSGEPQSGHAGQGDT